MTQRCRLKEAQWGSQHLGERLPEHSVAGPHAEHREYEGVGEHENHLGGREAGIDPEVAGLRPAESVHGPIGQPKPRPNLCALIFDEDHKLTTTRMAGPEAEMYATYTRPETRPISTRSAWRPGRLGLCPWSS